MKIFIGVDSIYGGAGNVAKIIAEYYAKKGNKVYLFLRRRRPTTDYLLNNVNIVGEQNFSSLRTFHKEIPYLNKLIKQISPDVIISFLSTVSPQILFSQWFSKIPIIVSERSNPFMDIPKKRYIYIRNLSYNRADKIVVQFQCFAHFNKKAMSQKKVVVIPNMILSSKHTKEHFLEQSNVSFVTFASLFSVKRIDLMINLFHQIHKINPETSLNIYGKGTDQHKLTQLIIDLNLSNVVKLKGHVNNVHECLRENDIYLMTSEREGFPNALSEAMAVGLPSICFKCHEGLGELIIHGKNGFLIQEGNLNEFISTANYLINNPQLRKKVGQDARKSIDKYNIDSVMRMWDETIDSVINTVK